MIIISKGFIKRPAIKQSPFFLRFYFLIECCKSGFFLSLSKCLEILETWEYFIDKLLFYIKIEKM